MVEKRCRNGNSIYYCWKECEKKEEFFDESMMQFDCASTVAFIFGLKQPQVWIGRPMIQLFK